MSRYGGPPTRLQLGVWAMGAALSMGYYLARSTGLQRPHPTRFGVERCLMGLGETQVQLRESPHGGRWFLTRTRSPIDDSPIFLVVSHLPASVLWRLLWAGHGPNPRWLSPFEPSGTWLLEENGVRCLWSLTACRWIDESHLWGDDADPDEPTMQWTLDLRTGRSARTAHDYTVDDDQSFQYAASQEEYEPEPDVWRTLASALEELPLDRDGSWGYGSIIIGGKEYYLVDAAGPTGKPVALYAVSGDPAPRILRLTGNARPLALGRDGRALFFERNRALWRLDLRKPLPALLGEIPVPELPDPLQAGMERSGYPQERVERESGQILAGVPEAEPPVYTERTPLKRAGAVRRRNWPLTRSTRLERRALAPGSPAGARREGGHNARIE